MISYVECPAPANKLHCQSQRKAEVETCQSTVGPDNPHFDSRQLLRPDKSPEISLSSIPSGPDCSGSVTYLTCLGSESLNSGRLDTHPGRLPAQPAVTACTLTVTEVTFSAAQIALSVRILVGQAYLQLECINHNHDSVVGKRSEMQFQCWRFSWSNADGLHAGISSRHELVAKQSNRNSSLVYCSGHSRRSPVTCELSIPLPFHFHRFALAFPAVKGPMYAISLTFGFLSAHAGPGPVKHPFA